ncbi:MAG TPA: hypothetical protein VE222_03440 [Nitrospiraceae bacterium]|nr:hypothetical protein [Nitrospiraceae bacterium]
MAGKQPGIIENLDPYFDPRSGKEVAHPARKNHHASLSGPKKTARPIFSSLTSNWPWAIIRTTSSPFSWNVHVAYIIRVQYFVAQQ